MRRSQDNMMRQMMEPEEAGRRIVRAIERGSSEYAFPLPMKMAVGMSKIILQHPQG